MMRKLTTGQPGYSVDLDKSVIVGCRLLTRKTYMRACPIDQRGDHRIIEVEYLQSRPA